jgi:riboflavin kinase / FMN adenylyltransferase
LVRDYVLRGDIADARDMLGRYPFYRGEVIKGEGRGRELGWPTANVRVADNLCLPGAGVYAGVALRAGKPLAAAVVNTGYAPTFGGRTKPLLEAHLLDFTGDLYGSEILVEFRARLRSETRFETPADLAEQIAIDARLARDMILLTDIERRSEE